MSGIKKKKMVVDIGEFADEQKELERKRAIKNLAIAKGFACITINDNDGVNVVSSSDGMETLYILAVMKKQLVPTLEEHITEGPFAAKVLLKMIMDDMK